MHFTVSGGDTSIVETISSNLTSCKVTGTNIYADGAGVTCTITATKASNDNYNASNSVIATITLYKASQTAPIINVSGTQILQNGVYLTVNANFTASGGNGSGAYIWSAVNLLNTRCVKKTIVGGSNFSVNTNATGTTSFPFTLYRMGDTLYNQSAPVTVNIRCVPSGTF